MAAQADHGAGGQLHMAGEQLLHAPHPLVNLGIAGFAVSVIWFYFSDIFDKVSRSLGLIGLGVLFLAGGWALERMRRRLIGHMGQSRKTIHADGPKSGLAKEEAQ